MKKVAIIQSNYVPWKGYFDIINSVDEFIIFDDVQFTKNDWRNRNQIKTANQLQWLTVPVSASGKFGQTIAQTKIANAVWARKHWMSIHAAYAKSPFFKINRDIFEPLYLENTYSHLSTLNFTFITAICSALGIQTKIKWSSEYTYKGENASERLLNLCQAAGATSYVAGPRSVEYLDFSLFNRHSLPVVLYDYNGYPEYSQLHPPFIHTVSVLDLLFNEGPRAPLFMKSFSRDISRKAG